MYLLHKEVSATVNFPLFRSVPYLEKFLCYSNRPFFQTVHFFLEFSSGKCFILTEYLPMEG